MRGKLVDFDFTGALVRDIPAYAGKTKGQFLLAIRPAEHPRVCGENRVFGL